MKFADETQAGPTSRRMATCVSVCKSSNEWVGQQYEEFKLKKRFIHFYQFEIFAAEKQRK